MDSGPIHNIHFAVPKCNRQPKQHLTMHMTGNRIGLPRGVFKQEAIAA